MTELESAVVETTSVLEALRIPYILIGGLAVSMWGEPRATVDIDLALWIEPEQFEPTVTLLCGRLRPLPQDPLGFVRQTRVLPVVTSQGVRADLVFAALPSEREAISRARPMQVGDKTVKVASVEDLILMKLVSERPKDCDDALRLVRRFKDSLDRPYLEPRLKELAEALARPGILDAFQGALEARNAR